MKEFDFDVVIIGSGFGGSVSALRLAEKGYRVCVLEAGRRFGPDDFPRTSWDLRRFLWAPRLGCFGIQRIHRLPDAVILAGAGVGGGSLVYANTLYEPLEQFFRDPQWSSITDWRAELAPYYDLARRMLGAVDNPMMTPADEVMRRVADGMGKGSSFRLTPVAVHFGDGPRKLTADPFFGGVGPDRSGCTHCGGCMTGCRFGAKNTLTTNYLFLAEALGVEIRPMSTVTTIVPLDPDQLDRSPGYAVEVRPTAGLTASTTTVTARDVIVAAGTYNTQKLLHRMRDEGHLPRLGERLGMRTRTNSESLVGAIGRRGDGHDFTVGVAISSSFHPDEHTHIEPVRYTKGANAMGLLGTVLTDAEPGRARWRVWLRAIARDPRALLRTLDVRGWSERSVIALVMQDIDNSITVTSGRSRWLRRWRLRSQQGHGAPNPTWIPVANEVARRMAEDIGGVPAGSVADLVEAPMTAHFIGGVCIGADSNSGVIDAWHRVFGHPGLHVVDGSAVSANLGANPSLTITAQAERAMAFWPNRGQDDPRPVLGSAYYPLSPVFPGNPAVPTGAPAALRPQSSPPPP